MLDLRQSTEQISSQLEQISEAAILAGGPIINEQYIRKAGVAIIGQK
jgi:hypothetical protein